MRNILAIGKKEYNSYLASPMAYVVTGIFLILTGVFFGTSPSTYLETSISGVWGFWGQLIIMAIAALSTKFNAWIALFNLIPLGILDGSKVFWWNKAVWGLSFAVSITLTVLTFTKLGPF